MDITAINSLFEKGKVLDKLITLSVEELDRLRDEKALELRGVGKEYYLAKDEELVLRRDKRNKLLSEGNSLSKTEQMLRGDEDLFNLKRKIMALKDLKNQKELEKEIITSYYWKVKS